MKERPILFSGEMVRAILDGRKTQTRRVVKQRGDCSGSVEQCPYGQPGERLWVRETWATEGTDETSTLPLQFKADRSDWPKCSKWRPSIHMPRWASRITLEIESVRVERLQKITEEDAKAEGTRDDALVHYYCEEGTDDDPIGNHRCNWRYAFSRLWESINAKRGFGWDANPWVWVITFRRVE